MESSKVPLVCFFCKTTADFLNHRVSPGEEKMEGEVGWRHDLSTQRLGLGMMCNLASRFYVCIWMLRTVPRARVALCEC